MLDAINIVDISTGQTINNQTIFIKEGYINKITDTDGHDYSNEYTVIDCKGKTVIPGLIDSHLHLEQSGVDDFMMPYKESKKKKVKRNMNVNLANGITTVRNMPGGQGFKMITLKKNIDKGKLHGPTVVNSGPALCPPYGYFSTKMFFPFPRVVRALFKRLYKVTSLSVDIHNEDEARQAVRYLKTRGVDFIKTMTPGSFIPYTEDEVLIKYLKNKGMKEAIIHASLSKEILAAICDEAHRANLTVAAHTMYGTKGFHEAVIAGVDTLEHTPFGKISDDVFIAMKNRNVYWVPTAFAPNNYLKLLNEPAYYDQLMEYLPKPFFNLGQKSLDRVRQAIESKDLFHSKVKADIEALVNDYIPYNIKRAHQLGVTIIAGVDAGASGAGYVPHGMLTHELDIFVKHGLSTHEALKSATIIPAKLLGIEHLVGSIEVGKCADLVVLNKNPLNNIEATRDIAFTLRKGLVIQANIR